MLEALAKVRFAGLVDKDPEGWTCLNVGPDRICLDLRDVARASKTIKLRQSEIDRIDAKLANADRMPKEFVEKLKARRIELEA